MNLSEKLKCNCENSVSKNIYPIFLPQFSRFTIEVLQSTPQAQLTSNIYDFGYDADSDGKYDFLIVEVEVNVSTPGLYAVYSELRDLSDNTVSIAINTSYLETGNHLLKLRFSGEDIRLYGYSGSFMAIVGLYSVTASTYNQVDVVQHNTKIYAYTQFLISPPQFFDWRNFNGQNYITPAKDQGTCGSCWAFAAIGDIEAKYNIDNSNPNIDLDLSEQELVSCCYFCGGGCGGGDSRSALEYAASTGIVNESCFPYAALDLTCNVCSNPERTKIRSFERIFNGSPTLIKRLLIDHGPVIGSMYWSDTYSYWEGDVLRCAKVYDTNHGILIVGYNDTGEYWIVKNSWGADWGDGGFFKLGYGECNITFQAYVTAIPKAQLSPPVALFNYTPAYPETGKAVTFNASLSYDPDGTIVSYEWEFGDGNSVTTAFPVVQHTYASSGIYFVSLTVTDDDGLTASASRQIMVISSTPEIHVNINAPSQIPINHDFQAIVEVDQVTNLTGFYLIITYNPSILEYLGYQLGSDVSSFVLSYSEASTPGEIRIATMVPDPRNNSVSGTDIELLILEFRAINNGTSSIEFNENSNLSRYNLSTDQLINISGVTYSGVSVQVILAKLGDLDSDGDVDFNDLIGVLNLILTHQYHSAADIDNDADVDFNDLIGVLNLILAS
jgi:C1A family cysteine protease